MYFCSYIADDLAWGLVNMWLNDGEVGMWGSCSTGYADSNASGCHKSLMVMMAVPQRLAEDAKTGIVVSCCKNGMIKTVGSSLMRERIIQHVK